MKMRTETKQNYAKKPNRISISEVSEKNALITDRRNARIETENNQKSNDNKRGCNIVFSTISQSPSQAMNANRYW